MATTIALERSGTAMQKMVTWWVALAWEMAKESSSVNHVRPLKTQTNILTLSKKVWRVGTWINVHVCPHRRFSVLWWWQSLPGGKPVAEGVPGCYLHLHMLRRTAGMTPRLRVWCLLYSVTHTVYWLVVILQVIWSMFKCTLVYVSSGLAMWELPQTRCWYWCQSAAAW